MTRDAERPVDQDVMGSSPRGPWADVPDASWTDWRWQQRERIRTADALARVVRLSSEEREACERAAEWFRMAITPYYAALMDPEDPKCPVRRQAVPSLAELTSGPWDLQDPLGEEASMPVPGLTHRYPDRVLWYVTHNCPVYCRHCTRKRKVSNPASQLSQDEFGRGLAYLASHPEVKDVLVSGGDPMTLGDDRLVGLLERVRAIPHVEVIRLCTRNPVTLPFRFTPELVARLVPLGPIYLQTHFNHPRECTPEAARCLRMLALGGLVTSNQMVLLAGINDDPTVVRDTNRWLLRQRCRPYYLFQADLAKGVSHFRTPVESGLAIIRALRGHVSGLAIPHYVIDAPGGGGKVPLVPDYQMRKEGARWRFLNYLGEPYEYPAE
jgi:lysine 2,3-aminomutase